MKLVVVPCVNNPFLTKRCVESVLTQDIGDIHLLAIDNGSTDGVGAYLRTLTHDGRVTLIAHSKMVNLNRIWNDALRLAFDSLRLDYALVINNDVILRTDTMRSLVEDGGLFVTGVSVGSMTQTQEKNVSSRSPHPSFSCFLIRKECWQRVGQFDEDFFAYCSDADYHLRMDAAGIDAYAIALPFYHEVSSTIRHASNEDRDWLQAQAEQDRCLFARKWHCAVGSPEYYAKFRAPRENVYATSGRLDQGR